MRVVSGSARRVAKVEFFTSGSRTCLVKTVFCVSRFGRLVGRFVWYGSSISGLAYPEPQDAYLCDPGSAHVLYCFTQATVISDASAGPKVTKVEFKSRGTLETDSFWLLLLFLLLCLLLCLLLLLSFRTYGKSRVNVVVVVSLLFQL